MRAIRYYRGERPCRMLALQRASYNCALACLSLLSHTYSQDYEKQLVESALQQVHLKFLQFKRAKQRMISNW